jgi:nucleoside-diphosphate-sugar epimerase
MTLLITGIHGFVGSNLVAALKGKHSVYGLDIVTPEKDGVVRTYAWEELNNLPKIDTIIHLAGKAHSIPKTEVEKQVFFDVNYLGTVNLCKALEISGVPKSFIFISTVAVYGCDCGENITEDHPRNGTTPYALSKIKAEDFLKEWCEKHHVILSILRPSLIAGPNPPGNLGDMIKGIKTGHYFSIAGGKARKSVVMVQDIAYLIPLLAEKGGIYNVCSNEQPSFCELETLIAFQLNKRKPFNIPLWLAKIFAFVGNLLGEKAPINSLKLRKITMSLTFSNEKAKSELGWCPANVLERLKIF